MTRDMFGGEMDKAGRTGAQFSASPVPATAQLDYEFRKLVGVYAEMAPKKVIEIGTYHGGSLFQWISNAAPGTRVVSVDLMHDAPAFQKWADDRGVILTMVSGASWSQDAIAATRRAIGDEADFLFIDGGHEYAEAKLDLVCYGPMVRKGGLIAMHDILVHSTRRDVEIHKVWAEVREAGYKVMELCSDRNQGLCGIGVIFV